MQTIVKLSCKEPKEMDSLVNFSKMCIQLHDISYVENKTETLSKVLSKLRIGGELLVDFINFDRILTDYNSGNMPQREMFEKIKDIPYYTEYEDFLKFVKLHTNFSIYKVVQEKTVDIVSIVRNSY